MIYLFEDFRLDPERRELRRGNDLVACEPRVFDLVEYLIRNRDRVVSKDDLIASVWHGRIVSESALSSRLTAARHAVNDSGEEQRFIRTIPRKGIRFVADVRVAEPAQETVPRPASGTEPSSAAYPAALELPDKPSIVVLPFANLSGDLEQEYFADGMVEDITIALGRLPWLFVIGSTTAFTYKNRPVEARQVGAELSVRYLLRGSVRRERDRVRITAELTDTSDGRHIWADRFEGQLDGVFEMQDTVAAHVSTTIAPALRNVEIERARRKPTGNLTAYDLFLRALPHHTASLEQNEASLALLYRAIDLDPSYSSAYGLAAWCHFWRKIAGWVPPNDPRLEEGIRLAALAMDASAGDSEALWMAGQTLMLISGELDAALVPIERALALNPNAPNAWWASGMTRLYRGDLAAGLDHHARALRLNPVNPWAYYYSTGMAFGHLLAGRYAETVRYCDVPLVREPAFVPALRAKAAALGMLGEIGEARICIDRLLTVVPGMSLETARAHYAAPLKQNPGAMETILDGLRRAGMPEM